MNYFKQTFNDFDTGFNPVAAGLNTGVTIAVAARFSRYPITGFDEIGLTPPLGRIDTTGHITETLSYVTKANTNSVLAVNTAARALDVFYQRNARGTFSFDGTQGPWANNPSISDNLKSLADYLAGDVSSSSIQVGHLQR